ncbi:MAG: 1-(5-phosphoribosyl)-5-[(5-phosphoribosylamino)methylideneamino]imidazole-4-carboxamide isomerase, partial [Oscillospiraceae bacterium]
MIILPAIDIKDGNCVRLYKGNFNTAEKVAENPLETARKFQSEGASYLHLVDLDGAKEAKPINGDIFIEIAKKTSLKVEVGGGIRSLDTVEYYLQNGIDRVILGSAAIKNPAFVKEAVQSFGEKIVIGIDAMNEMVSIEGWLDSSKIHYIDLAKEMENIGVKHIAFTDISKDGTLEGPNLVQLDRICRAVSCHIIASGGISNIEDIKALKKRNIAGVICGKSL